MFNRKLVPTNRCTTWVNLESHTELRIWVWISLPKCNIFVTLGLDCNRVDRSQNGTCNAELSSIKPESRESIQSKITEPACAEFSATQTGNSAKKITCPSSRRYSCLSQREICWHWTWLLLYTKTNFFGEVLLCCDFSFPFIMLLLKGKCRIVSRTVTLHINLSLVDRSCLYSLVCLFRFVFFKHYFQARGRLKKQNLEKKKVILRNYTL